MPLGTLAPRFCVHIPFPALFGSHTTVCSPPPRLRSLVYSVLLRIPTLGFCPSSNSSYCTYSPHGNDSRRRDGTQRTSPGRAEAHASTDGARHNSHRRQYDRRKAHVYSDPSSQRQGRSRATRRRATWRHCSRPRSDGTGRMVHPASKGEPGGRSPRIHPQATQADDAARKGAQPVLGLVDLQRDISQDAISDGEVFRPICPMRTASPQLHEAEGARPIHD